MTPEVAPRLRRRVYRFECFCDAPIRTTERSVTCDNCGTTLDILLVESDPERWEAAPRERGERELRMPAREVPYRQLQIEDVGALAIRIGACFLLVYSVYDLVVR